jgi:hypothetical protein
MGFGEVLAKLTDKTKVRRARRDLSLFAANHPQAYENLDQDPHISDDLRQELIQKVFGVVPGKLSDIETRIENFFHGHQQRGPRDTKAEKRHLGHVETRYKLVRWLAKLPITPFAAVGMYRSASPLIDDLLSKKLDEQKSELDAMPLSEYQMFSFYGEKQPKNPFHGFHTTRKELIRRLGLGSVDPKSEILYWVHRLVDPQEGHTPTALDVELVSQRYFQPGGKTRPLTGSGSVPEVIHPPIVGTQLTRRIQEAD